VAIKFQAGTAEIIKKVSTSTDRRRKEEKGAFFAVGRNENSYLIYLGIPPFWEESEMFGWKAGGGKGQG